MFCVKRTLIPDTSFWLPNDPCTTHFRVWVGVDHSTETRIRWAVSAVFQPLLAGSISRRAFYGDG